MPLEELPAACALGHEFSFESYGVRVRIEASDASLLEEAERKARTALVDNLRRVESSDADHLFGISSDSDGTLHLFKDGQEYSSDHDRRRFFKFFDSILRIEVAEHAVGWVFIHAGVVASNGRAIIIPGDSFSGKTTLVQELVRAGAEYYSDEYAVLDQEGLVHPFPRFLSVRYLENGSLGERDVDIASIGGIHGFGPIPVGLVLLTRFVDGAIWEPETLSIGHGILETIPHTIPRHSNAVHALKVLNTAFTDAIILRSSRGDAAGLTKTFLSFF
ncbi:MAG TPA: hypothetical protein VJV05_17535 [Pyrinomonadaceae bacterium]|nr:hypothetical protein [Pyrinomonadaceae bacterium]